MAVSFFFTDDCDETNVHFGSKEHGLFLKNHHKRKAVSGVLVQQFFEHKYFCDMPFGLVRVNKFMPVASVILCVLGPIAARQRIRLGGKHWDVVRYSNAHCPSCCWVYVKFEKREYSEKRPVVVGSDKADATAVMYVMSDDK